MDYRLYMLKNEHIRRAIEFTSDTDDAAIDRATKYSDSHAMELWQESRLVKRFEEGEAASQGGVRPPYTSPPPQQRLVRE